MKNWFLYNFIFVPWFDSIVWQVSTSWVQWGKLFQGSNKLYDTNMCPCEEDEEMPPLEGQDVTELSVVKITWTFKGIKGV